MEPGPVVVIAGGRQAVLRVLTFLKEGKPINSPIGPSGRRSQPAAFAWGIRGSLADKSSALSRCQSPCLCSVGGTLDTLQRPLKATATPEF